MLWMVRFVPVTTRSPSPTAEQLSHHHRQSFFVPLSFVTHGPLCPCRGLRNADLGKLKYAVHPNAGAAMTLGLPWVTLACFYGRRWTDDVLLNIYVRFSTYHRTLESPVMLRSLLSRLSTPIERFLTLVVIAVVVGVSAGLLLPQVSDTVGGITGEHTATGSAAQTLYALQVVDHPRPQSAYQRSSFGYREYDADGNGCDVRNDVLARDLRNVTYKNAERCKVNSGVLQDPYTGKTIQFHRGATTSSAVQIDHVVALNDAWRSGASQWDRQKRLAFGNDPYNLLAVDGPSNEDKGDANAANWLPSNTDFACAYVARQIGVKARYGLSVTSLEKQAMLKTLHSCSGQGVPEV